MKRGEYVFAAAVILVFAYQEVRMKKIFDILETLADISGTLMEESYQNDIDARFEDIVEEHLDDLDDLD